MKTLEELSDQELLNALIALRSKEHNALIDVLLHMAEVDCRKLYRDTGYSSLFDYARRKLLYSESEAMKRIAATRCVREYPEILEALKRQRVNLSIVSLVSKLINKDNVKEVLKAVEGKTKREVEVYIAGFRPVVPNKEVIKPIRVVKKEIKPETSLFKPIEKPAEKPKVEEKRYELRFSVKEETMEKLDEVKMLLRNNISLEDILDEVLESYLEKKSAKRRQAIREKKIQLPIPGSVNLTQGVKDQVLKDDNYQCSFIAKDGTRCNCRTNLQVDHIKPRALGGDNSISNLRVLCGAHNRLMAEQKLGKEFMQRFY